MPPALLFAHLVLPDRDERNERVKRHVSVCSAVGPEQEADGYSEEPSIRRATVSISV